MGRVYNFAEFTIDRRADNHGYTCSFLGEKEKECQHLSLLFDENGHTVECKDCGKQVSAWWAFMSMVERFQREWQKIENAQKRIKQDEEKILTHRAAIRVEEAWRRRKLIPVCPHCRKPILPCDNFGAMSNLVDKRYAGGEARAMELKANLVVMGEENPESGQAE